MVDAAANLRSFVVIKSKDGDPTAKMDLAECLEETDDDEELCAAIADARKNMATSKTEQTYDAAAGASTAQKPVPPIEMPGPPQEHAAGATSTPVTPPSADAPVQAYKAEGDGPPIDGAPAAPAAPVSMPGAARQSILDALESLLRTATTVAQIVQGATVDDTAPMPPELVAAMSELGPLAAQLGAPPVAPASGPPAADGPPAEKAEKPEDKPGEKPVGAPFVGAAPPFEAEKGLVAKDGDPLTDLHSSMQAAMSALYDVQMLSLREPEKAAKVLALAQTTLGTIGAKLTALAAGVAMPEEMKAIAGDAAATTAGIAMAMKAWTSKSASAPISKAGKKMAATRLAMLKQAYEILSSLLKELMDETIEAGNAPSLAPVAPAPTIVQQAAPLAPPPPPVPPAKDAQLAKALEGLTGVLKSMTHAAPAPQVPTSTQTELVALREKVATQDAQLAEIAKSRGGEARGRQPEGGSPPQTKAPFVWPDDHAADVQRRQQAASGAVKTN